MHLQDISVYKKEYEKTSAQAKSYFVSIWFLLIFSIFHIVLNIKTSLDITLSYKWVVLAISTLIGVTTYKKETFREINMHIMFIYLTVLFIPYAFMTSGGQYSFIQYFMIVYLVLIFFMMELKYAAIYAIYNFLQLEVLYFLESQRPDLIKPLDLDWFALENAVTIPILMIIMVALVTILLVLHKSDEEKVRKQNSKLYRDAKLKDTMLKITYSTTQNYNRGQITESILSRLIDAMENAEQGYVQKIVKRKVIYDSAIGYDIKELKNTITPVQETYLYKATNGEMDRAVILSAEEREGLSIKTDIHKNLNRDTLCTPIMLSGNIWGILNVESNEGQSFSRKDKEFIKVFINEIEKVLSFSLLVEQNHKLRNYDYLTGIYNRLRFTEKIEEKISELKSNEFMSFITCDLDNFKLINDHYGHGNGDNYLKYFVAIVAENLEQDDIFGRTGGDEFQILMPHKSPSEANMVMQKIVKEFEKRPVVLKRNRIVLKFSYGIVQCYEGDSINDISLKSDQMLYRNKKINKLSAVGEDWTFCI